MTATMMKLPKSRLFLLLAAALVPAACAGPGPRSAAPAPVTVDAGGHVVRPNAERGRDDTIGRTVASRLSESDAGAFRNVSVLAWDGAVLLTGAVAKPEQRRRAGQIAGAVGGVSTVHNELTLVEAAAAAAFVADAGGEQRLQTALSGRSDIAGAYAVRMVNGVVYLLGTARSAEDVARATDFARDADGVKWVVEHVAIR